MKRVKAPKTLYAVLTPPGNPHADGQIQVFTSRVQAMRVYKWGDQRLVEYEPKLAKARS